MGDTRFREAYLRVRNSPHPRDLIRSLSDEEVIAALVVASAEAEPLLSNVLATEAQNRVTLYAAMFKSMSEGVFSVGADGRLKAINPAAQRVLGWTLEDVHGADTDALLACTVADRNGSERRCALCAETLQGKTVMREEDASFTRADGTRFSVAFTAAPILRDDDVQGAVVMFRDITGRQRAENAARRLAAIVEASDDAVLSLALDGTILTWNPRAEELYGYSAAEAIGRHVTLVVPPELQEEFDVLVSRVKNGEILHHYVTKRLQRGGKRVDIALTATPVRDETGKVTALSWIGHDITEVKAHEEALRASEQRYRLLLDSVTDHAIYLLDPKGYVLTWNPAAERIKQWKAEEIIGWHYSVLFPPEEVANGDPWKELEDARLKGRHDGEERRIRKDGSLFDASITLSAMHDPTGELVGFVKVTRDVSERKAWERRLQTSKRSYDVLFEMFSSPALWCDPKGSIVRANRALLDLLGSEESGVVGRPLQSLTEAPEQERVAAATDKVRDGVAQELSFTVVNRTGKRTELSWRLTPIVVEGVTTGFFAVGERTPPRE